MQSMYSRGFHLHLNIYKNRESHLSPACWIDQ